MGITLPQWVTGAVTEARGEAVQGDTGDLQMTVGPRGGGGWSSL